jgi:hypothetical protein
MKAYWIKYNNQIRPVPTIHIDCVIKNPDWFDVTEQYLQDVYSKHNEPFGLEGTRIYTKHKRGMELKNSPSLKTSNAQTINVLAASAQNRNSASTGSVATVPTVSLLPVVVRLCTLRVLSSLQARHIVLLWLLLLLLMCLWLM